MTRGFYYISCDKCNKIQSFEKVKKEPFHDNFDNDGMKVFSCTCGNIDLKIIVSKIALRYF